MLLPFQGATVPIRGTQGVATLALGWVLHWAFSPHLQNQIGRFSARSRETIVGPEYDFVANSSELVVFASAG